MITNSRVPERPAGFSGTLMINERKRMRSRDTLAILASTVMISAGLVAVATPAGASGPCGSGYSRVGTYAIPKTGKRTGTLQIYYNSGSGKNCALAYGYGATYGKNTYKMAAISVSGGSRWIGYESGTYKYYAGPVYVSARHKCIDINGWVGSVGRVERRVHCG
jgi:hypothetical protein